MKKVVQLAVLSSAFISAAQAAPQVGNVVYGEDNRVEVYEATEAQQVLARAAAAMVSINKMSTDASRPESIQFDQASLRDWIESAANSSEEESHKFFMTPALKKAAKEKITFCDGTRFAEQANPAMCSGFLIAPDLIVTAGHCVELENFCEEYRWVFDFQVDKNTQTAGVDVKPENIYKCKQVRSNSLLNLLGLDYAVVQLDRKVKDREPVTIRNSGKIAEGEALTLIGNPSGLPLKVAAGANVRKNTHPSFFSATTDSFAGNSGSAVFNSTTGVVEGILVRGEEDYVPNYEKMCIQANVCETDSCRGEDISRMTSIPEVGIQRALVAAAISGDEAALSSILKIPAWVDFYTKDGQSALIKAAAAAKTNSLKLLLKKGADVNLQDAVGNTALHELSKVVNETNAEALSTLVAAGAKPEVRNDVGDTALLTAGKSLNLAAVKLLISAGADMNALDAKGENVMFEFVRQGQDKAVLELAGLGVDPKPVLKIAKRGLKIRLALKKIVKN